MVRKINRDLNLSHVRWFEKLKTEREASSQRKAQLLFHAPSDGMIGSVFFKVNEEVPPFAPILSIHPKTPSYIKGYIHEDVINNIAVNQKVKITPLAPKDLSVAQIGVVKSIGARIVEYPERLKKHRGIPVWGREILISIPKTGGLLLGERVLIAAEGSDSGGGVATTVNGFLDRVSSLFHLPMNQG